MSLFDQFRRHMKRHNLLHSPMRIVVAVSGGPDSICLLHMLWRLQEELRLDLHVAHLDHGFRAAESAAEAQYVAAFAAQLALPATIERRDVTTLMKGQIANKMAAARAVRYAFLAEVAQQTQADAVAVAHQADDQAETVLMHMLRGAGLAGLRGMRPYVPWEIWSTDISTDATSVTRPALIRPLLATSRADIEAYCTEYNLDPRHDPSNHATTFTRSRVRLELLPLLQSYNSQISSALFHTAATIGDDYDYIQTQLDTLWPMLVSEAEGRVTYNLALWKSLHRALQRYALRRAVEQLSPGKEANFEQIDMVCEYIASGIGQLPNMPGDIRIVVNQDTYSLMKPHAEINDHRDTYVPQLRQSTPVAIPGATPIDRHWTLIVTTTKPDGWGDSVYQLVVDFDKLSGPLAVRGRQPGDRFRPEGGVGSRRLQDFFVDQKIQRELRDHWPLLFSADAVVWVIGLRADSRFQPDTTTSHRIWLQMVRGDEHAISFI